jgi:CHAT domain-containing protein
LYALLLSAADGSVRAIRLGPLGDASARIDAWNAALADRNSALAVVAARGRAVRELLWDPLRPGLTGQRVFLIPSGALFRVPWAALPDQGGFLIDAGWTFHGLNHERELLGAPPPPSVRLLAVADPAPLPTLLAARADCPGTGDAMAALPGARREAERLGALWSRRFGGTDAALMLVGADATEARVRAESTSFDILHFATHSVGGGCASGSTRSLALVAETPASDGAAPPLPPAALALAAVEPARGDNDGLLGGEEIATLDLSRVRWAVLAACATAAGPTRHYEGLFGLSRAFRLAGAHTVIMSLWPVDDAATAQWTEALYDARVTDGVDTAAAMRAAQRSVLAARREQGESVHPYYWAAFIAAGDWR